MPENKTIPAWLSIVMLLLCLSALALSAIDTVHTFNTEGLLLSITQVICSLSVIFALLYCVYGFTKNAAGYFSLVTGSMLATDFCASLTYVISDADASAKLLPAAMCMLSFGCLAILLIAKDLKKVKSFVLTNIIFIAYVVRTVVYITTYGLTSSYNVILSNFALALVLEIMVYAKYEDKAARGRD